MADAPFGRYAVGWAVAHRESAELAKRLIDWTVRRQRVPPGQLTIHADRGSVMTSKPVAFLITTIAPRPWPPPSRLTPSGFPVVFLTLRSSPPRSGSTRPSP